MSLPTARGQVFSDVADAYERARPGYPAEIVDQIISLTAPTTESVVLDLGAGTGKMTRLLSARIARVVAVEPQASMREHARATAPQVAIVGGHGEDIGLPDGAVDGVVVATAFHWFAGHAALEEIARVLRPGGVLVLVWNRDDPAAPWHERENAILDEFGRAAQRRHWSDWQDAFTHRVLFGPMHASRTPHLHVVDVDTAIDLVSSVSFVAAMDDDDRLHALQALRSLYEQHASADGTLAMPLHADLYWTRRLVAASP